MSRKVLTIGKSSYAITLPRSFINENDLNPGQELHVSHQGNELLVYPRNGQIKIQVDLDGVTEPCDQFFTDLMQGLFLYGAQQATLVNTNKTLQDHVEAQTQKPDTNFYIKEVNQDTMHLRCPLNTLDTESYDNLIRHALQQIYRNMHDSNAREQPYGQQLNLTRRALSQRIESRTHLALYSFVEKLELIIQVINDIEGTPEWLEEYADAIYMMQQVSKTHSNMQLNKLCEKLQDLADLKQELDDEHKQYANPLYRYLKQANRNLLIAYA